MKINIRKMKFATSLCVSVLLWSVSYAQQKPQYTQYVLNEYIINPALSGIENYFDLKISHRHQWVGISDAPVTTYITIQGPIDKKDDRSSATTLFPTASGENMRGKQYWDEYAAAPAHSGVGLQIINDQAGPFNTFSITGTYAYHMPIGPKTNLSAGLGIGARKLTLNQNKLFFGEDYPVDPAVYTSGELGKTRMDMNAGLWLYSANYFVGLAALQILPQKIDFSDNAVTLTKGKTVPHLFATVGYRFLLNDDINMLPSIMVKDVSPVPTQIDYNVKLQYQDLVWIGATYRGKYGFAGMAGFNAANYFTFSYSYDYSTTQLNTVSKGTHEIIIGFALGNKYSDETCPKRVW